jgi:hypothetical protein
MKKEYAILTYAILVKGNYIVMVTIAHNQIGRDLREMCDDIVEDAKIDEENNFIRNWF